MNPWISSVIPIQRDVATDVFLDQEEHKKKQRSAEE
jgi:hypothetical protein